ncbi:uncharacterized protein [Leptinotarsa decemlineata]|uniref:uncharacterized protein n=1 Tax=Leptinotarsa decemlineata TaxID=7539 RepID=UPI003D3041D3
MQNYSSRTQRILQMAKETNINTTRKEESFTGNPTTTGAEEIIDTTLLSINNENNQLTDIETSTASMFQRSTESLDEIDKGYTVTNYDRDCPTVMRLTKIKPNRFYYVSPVHSNESDVDDSDVDKNFTHSSTDSLSESSNEHDVVHCSSDRSDKHEVGSSSLETTDTDNVDKNEVEMGTKKGRKRGRKPENWINKQASLLRNSGKAYQSSSKSKKQFPQRKVRPPCGEKCRLACSSKINNLIRQEIFYHYWGLANLQSQSEFIVRHTTFIKPKYRYSSTQDHRKLNSAFYFEINKTRVRVCKAFFKSTLDINDRPIRTALIKKTDNGFLEPEMRGKHGKQPTIDPELKNSVGQFIEAIPRVESHYLRAQTTREFIDSGKSLADLFRDYKDDRQKQNLPFTNAAMFNRIFRDEYNISFYIPKKDQCDLCESFKNADEERKKTLLSAYNMHKKEKELSRTEKDNDKKIRLGLMSLYRIYRR